jgi:3-methyladenine DNA glycosylase AlkD
MDGVLRELQKLGKPKNVQIYSRHGVSSPCYGVAHGDLKPLAKRIGRDQHLALELWRSGVHDARVLATMIAEPDRMTRAQIEGWLHDCGNYVLTDAVSGVAARMPDALEMALSWIVGEGEWITTAGWNVIGASAGKDQLTAPMGNDLLQKIEQTIDDQPNRTRYAMNNALIGIGSYAEPFRARALAVAKAIGKVDVDHGDTGCKTPDAAAYIAKVVAYKGGKSRARPPR